MTIGSSSAKATGYGIGLGLALLAALAGIVPGVRSAAAQEPAEGSGDAALPPPEVLNRICPEYAAAEGRLKAQLALLFFTLDPERRADEKQVAAVRAAFDADKAEDVEVLRRYLVQDKKPRCLSGVRVALGALGARGAALLVLWYAEDNADVRARVLDGLALVETQETYGLVVAALDDKRPVSDWAAREAPPGYVPKRVADYAYRAMGGMLSAAGNAVNLPAELAGGAQVGPLVSVATRDAKIQELRDWLAGPASLGYRTYLKGLPSLAAELKGAEAERVKKVLQDLGVK
ncbi:MAG: hypothetical protein HYZ53_28430 [Planctomycetes bacterium]|nr:hypothetical protein [Planctomycetota bacterium]